MSMLKDPMDDFNDNDYREMKWLESLPKCDSCGEPIQDNPYHEIPFGGMQFKICGDCLTHYQKWRDC